MVSPIGVAVINGVAVIRNYLKRHLGPTRAALRRVRAAIPEPRTPIDIELHSPWLQAYRFRNIIDIGANEGTFAKLARRAFPDAHIYSFEPLPHCARILRVDFADDRLFSLFTYALGDRSGDVRMYKNEYSASSSILAMAKEHIDAFPYTARTDQITVPLRTLDEVLREVDLPGSALMKLDVQGYELKVLTGARETLSRVRLVLLELSLVPLYQGAPVFEEVYAFLSQAGFKLRGVVDVLRRPADDRPLQLDAIFERA